LSRSLESETRAPVESLSRGRARRDRRALASRLRDSWTTHGTQIVIAIWALLVVVATVQRGVLSQDHTTFPIFRQSYFHLISGSDLYLFYPHEQGTGPADLFKYSPTWALLYGPFAVLPFAWSLLLWNGLNAAVLFIAVRAILPRPSATLALLLISPWLLHAVQSSSSNGLVAGLILLAFHAIERGRHWGAAFTIASGALIKIFPVAAVSFALFRPGKWRFAAALVVALLVLIALPLTVVSTDSLLFQYANWRRMVMLDENDLIFGRSVLGLMREVTRVPLPNWPAQLLGAMLLMVPVLLRRDRWDDQDFRLRFLSALLVFAVIFNHQAEHQSYVIAAAGVAIWFVTSPLTAWRVAVLVGCLIGLEAVPYTIAWLVMMTELVSLKPEPQLAGEAETLDDAIEGATAAA
jgi:hypothetical protein